MFCLFVLYEYVSVMKLYLPLNDCTCKSYFENLQVEVLLTYTKVFYGEKKAT